MTKPMLHTERLIAAAHEGAKRLGPTKFTRTDGTVVVGERLNHFVFSQGIAQVYIVPIEQRTTIRKPHYRYTFYMLVGGAWKRVKQSVLESAMEKEA